LLFICCSGRPENAYELQVRLGGILATDPDPDAVYANVSHVIPHPKYRRTGLVNDIGLLRLSSPVMYTDTILPICLPSPNVDLNQFKVCVDTGFGRTDYFGLSTLYQVKSPVGYDMFRSYSSYFARYSTTLYKNKSIPTCTWWATPD